MQSSFEQPPESGRESREAESDLMLASLCGEFSDVAARHVVDEKEIFRRAKEAKAGLRHEDGENDVESREHFYKKFIREEKRRIYALRTHDLNALRERYERQFPDRMQEIAILFGIDEMNAVQKKLDAQRAQQKKRGTAGWGSGAERKKMFEFLAGWNYLSTDHVVKNAGDKKYLEDFWGTMESVSESLGGKGFYRARKRGILGQAGVYHLMRMLGMDPNLATPKEDMSKIDMWADVASHKDAVVQAKYSSMAQEPIFERTDNIHYPSVRTETKSGIRHFASDHIKEMYHLKDSCRRQSERSKKNVTGFYVVLPEYGVDQVTGEPSEEMVLLGKQKFIESAQ